MDYFKILKDSYQITIKRKYLWLFGLFAGGSIFTAGGNMNFYGTNSFSDEWSKNFNGANSPSFDHFWTNYWGVVVAVLGLIFLLGFLWMVFSIISRGAIVGSIRQVKENKENSFRWGFAFGWHKFWRVFAVSLIIGLLFIVSAAILVVPIILFVLAKIYVLVVLYGLLVFFLALGFWLYLVLVQPYILNMVILSDKGSWEAVKFSWPFFRKNWKEILVIYLLMMAVGLAVALGFLIAIILIGGILFLIGLAIYLASAIAVWIYAGLAILAFLILLAVFAGAINTFSYSVFTLVYLELEKSKS